VPVYEEKTIYTTERVYEDETVLHDYGVVEKESIRAVNRIGIESGNDINLSGRIFTSDSDSLIAIQAANKVTIEGILPKSAQYEEKIAAFAEIKSQGDIDIKSGRDVLLNGLIEVERMLNVTAGTDQSHLTGNISGGLYADIITVGDGSAIVMNAGTNGGEILLVDSALTSETGEVRLSADSGTISHSGGRISSTLLYVRAKSGLTANTTVARVDAELTDRGNIVLTNVGDIELEHLVVTDGTILVETYGDIVATHVETRGPSDDNDISLRTFPGSGDLGVGMVTTGGVGDVILDVAGDLIHTGPPPLIADHLKVTAQGRVILSTKANLLSLETTASGDVAIDEEDDLLLKDILVLDGSFSVTAGGALTAEQVRLATNSNDNDVTLTAESIQVGLIEAGVYAGTEEKADTIRLDFFNAALRAIGFITDGGDDFTLAEAKAFGESPDFDQAHDDLKTHLVDVGNFDPEEADTDAGHILLMEKTFTSLGDLMLKATTGTITEMTPEDPEVDIIADEAVLEAENGIHGIEFAVNSLTVQTTHGAIGLVEEDGYGERLAGLTIVSAASGDGSIDITATESLEVTWASAEDPGGNVRLASIQGNLVVLKPDSGDAILAGEGITLMAGQMIIFQGPVSASSLLEFRAGTGVVFLVEESLTISADTIIIESGQSITIDGTISASELVELISNRGNIKVTGEIIGKNGGELKQLSLIARGNMVIEGALKGYFEYRSNGQTYYMDREGRVYDQGLNEVPNAEDLDLIPVLQKENKQVYDDHTGMAMYQDPNNLETGVHYYLNIGNEIFYLLQDTETGPTEGIQAGL
jgi:hypothetical protein